MAKRKPRRRRPAPEVVRANARRTVFENSLPPALATEFEDLVDAQRAARKITESPESVLAAFRNIGPEWIREKDLWIKACKQASVAYSSFRTHIAPALRDMPGVEYMPRRGYRRHTM